MEPPGARYRIPISLCHFLYTSEEQKRIAQAYIAQLDAAKSLLSAHRHKNGAFPGILSAEGYHQDYLKNNPDNPYIVYNDLPKLENLKKSFPSLYQP